jgi:hypothetical protein
MGSVEKNLSASKRAQIETELRGLLRVLTAKLRRDNPWVRDFVTAAERLQEAEAAGETVGRIKVSVDAERAPEGAAPRTYIGDGASEVYVVMPDDLGNGEFGRFTLKLRPDAGRAQQLQQMDGVRLDGGYATHRAADPTHFPLLFPRGQDGWSQKTTVPQGAGEPDRKVTAREWYV